MEPLGLPGYEERSGLVLQFHNGRSLAEPTRESGLWGLSSRRRRVEASEAEVGFPAPRLSPKNASARHRALGDYEG